MSFSDVYNNKTILVTGNTGFKGSWICEWLLKMGARVVGYSLDPNTSPCLYDVLDLRSRLQEQIPGDVRDLEQFKTALRTHQPDLIFHLAAQPLVREGFLAPHYTMQTNVMGSLNILEAVRQIGAPCVVIMVTTDKVYENTEWLHAYRENDPLGGYDPYSASKACAEMIISSYQRSYFLAREGSMSTISVASARGGNVIGGGDWSKDRIVPDSIRHLAAGEKILVRNKWATRPWQHVLELLSGYLLLGAEIYRARKQHNLGRLKELCTPFNFGPSLTSNQSVGDLVQEILRNWPGEWEDHTEPNAPHEAGLLNLTTDKAYHTLGWRPRWNFEDTIRNTVSWYRHFYEYQEKDPKQIQLYTMGQIKEYAQNRSYLIPTE